MKKTVVIGASDNPNRYAYKAVINLQKYNFPVVPLGIKKGEINGLEILHGKPLITEVDTITLYISAKHQPEYYDYFLSLQPKRIIFNPGTENPELYVLAKAKGIEVLNACTLVLLSVGDY